MKAKFRKRGEALVEATYRPDQSLAPKPEPERFEGLPPDKFKRHF